MAGHYPKRTRVYQNHHLDSTRWEVYTPRDDDIIISTSYKSGTTWTQYIVRELIVHSMQAQGIGTPDRWPLPGDESSEWVDARWHGTKAELSRAIEAQTHRRFLKTHLALDGLPFYPQVSYLVIGRDPRDVFMSMWNHYSAYTDYFYAKLMQAPDLVGLPCPRCPEDIHAFWRGWIGQGWFAWEHEGFPFWGNMHHNQSWWNYRQLDNICLLHYADMLADPLTQIKRIADFLKIAVSDEVVARIAEYTSLSAVRQRAVEEEVDDGPSSFQGGAGRFFFKGTNGRWRDILTEAELAMYQQTRDMVLTPDCARWLEQGDIAFQ